MKKAILVLGLILALGLLGCGAKKPAADSQSKSDDNQDAKAADVSGSLGDLLGKNSNLKCTVKETAGSSTTYISGKKARNDSQSVDSNGQTTSSHMIVDEEWLYTWTDQVASSAVKVKLSDLNTSEFNDAQTAGQAGNFSTYQQKANYSCLPWSVDDKMFTPPADVNFVNFSDMFNQLQGLGTGAVGGDDSGDNSDNSNLCAQCDLIPDATAKSQCKSNLGCK